MIEYSYKNIIGSRNMDIISFIHLGLSLMDRRNSFEKKAKESCKYRIKQRNYPMKHQRMLETIIDNSQSMPEMFSRIDKYLIANNLTMY